MSTKTSRRAVLAGASSLAAVPLALSPSGVIAAPSDASERRLMEIEAEIDRLNHEEGKAIISRGHAEAERAVFEWERRNPKPVMRSVTFPQNIKTAAAVKAALQGSPGVPEPVADMLVRTTLTILDHHSEHNDPNADLKAAMAEHSAAVSRWEISKKAALKNYGFEEKEAAWNGHCDGLAALCDEATEIRATTIRGMKCKARIAENAGIDNDIAWSLVGDLLADEPPLAA